MVCVSKWEAINVLYRERESEISVFYVILFL